MANLEEQILAAVARKSYQPLKPKALARKLGVPAPQYADFRRRPPHPARNRAASRSARTTPSAPPRRTAPSPGPTAAPARASASSGRTPIEGQSGPEVRIPEDDALDAATGDVVLVRLTRKPNRPDVLPQGKSSRVLERATRQFRRHLLRARRRGFRPRGWHRLQPQHLRRRPRRQGRPARRQGRLRDGPLPRRRRTAARASSPRCSARAANPASIRCRSSAPSTCPTSFPKTPWKKPARPPPPSAKTTSRAARTSPATSSSPSTRPTPAISTTPCRLTRDREPALASWPSTSPTWATSPRRAAPSTARPASAPPASICRSACCRCSRRSISNHLASLQQGRLRYVKSVVIDFTPEGQKTGVRFANGAIRVRKRFTYEQVMAHLEAEAPPAADVLAPDVYDLLLRCATWR